MASRQPNLIPLFVTGRTKPLPGRAPEVVVLRLSPTERGWTQYSETCGHNNEYVSNETVEDLRQWFRCDFVRFSIFEDADDAAELAEHMRRNKAPAAEGGPTFF